jgi:catechol 2,3-dioxygenase-like lactoylglutathione lyase family enzyme
MFADSELTAFLATARPDEARNFYSRVLGLSLIEDTPFALVFSANGTTLRVQKVEQVLRQAYTSLGWNVANLSATLEHLIENGVSVERYEGLNQDQLGVWKAPDGTAVAWFRDPDGNLLSLTELR